MDKMFLTETEKRIIRVLAESDNHETGRDTFCMEKQEFNKTVETLQLKGLVQGLCETNESEYLACRLTSTGIIYHLFNPRLRDPKTEEEIKADKAKVKRRELKLKAINWTVVIISAVISGTLGFLIGEFF